MFARTISQKYRPQQPSGSKKKEHQDASKYGNKKWEGKYKKITTTTHHWKDTSNHYNHWNIDGHIEKKFCELHQETNPRNHKKDVKKKYVLVKNSSN